jgi:catechol 2,3-dioxygenase
VSTASAPIEIGHVALTVNDLGTMADFYRHALGLHDLSSDGETVRLGTGGRLLVELRGDRLARRRSPREAGLFHTAFLLPSRRSLGEWLIHSAESRIQLQGASDHLVSEAIYLADPEGNGIEVYADRPRLTWFDAEGRMRIATEPLDLDDLARAAAARWTGAPDGAVVGHVHLQVGDVARAEAFCNGLLGLPVMARYPGAAFFAAGGYHHHLAANIWNSRGAGMRGFPSTGLAEVGLLADPAEYAAVVDAAGSDRFDDPWGTPFSILRKAA